MWLFWPANNNTRPRETETISLSLSFGDGSGSPTRDSAPSQTSDFASKTYSQQTTSASIPQAIPLDLLEQALASGTSEPAPQSEPQSQPAHPAAEASDADGHGGSGAYPWRDPQGRKQGIQEYGGSAAGESCVEAGLRWLLRHQDRDGKWHASGFADHCKSPECWGRGAAEHTPGLTALAFLCFLAAGRTPGGKEHSELRETRRYLLLNQNRDGFFGDEGMYNHALVMLALAELYGQTGDPDAAAAVRSGVEATGRSQQEGGGWDYRARPSSPRNDTSITGWQILSLFAAKKTGIDVPDAILGRAQGHLHRFTSPGGEVRYADAGPRHFRRSRALSAVGLLCAIACGEISAEQKMQVSTLLAHPPDWKEVKSLDGCMYGWYHATIAFFAIGGEPWRQWNRHMLPTLVQNQVKAGEAAGSWPPECAWGSSGGRVYSTAICLLTLEIYYRYRPAFLSSAPIEELERLRAID